MRFNSWVIAASAMIFAASTASAQRTKQLETNASVRITPTVGKVLVGQIIGTGSDSISILESQSGVQRSIARDRIYRIQMKVKTGNKRSALKSGALGLVGGAIAGALLGAASSGQSSGDVCPVACTSGDRAAMGATFLGALGFLGGLVYGASGSSDQWVDVPVRQ